MDKDLGATTLEWAGLRWELQPDFAPQLAAVLAAPGHTIKASSAKTVTRHEVGDRTYYLKRYVHTAVPLRSWKFLFKPSQARQEWTTARGLEGKSVPIVRHLALGERRRWNGVRESVLITEGFPGITLDQAPWVQPAAVLEFLNALYDRGVLQEDMHRANILARADPFELRLVDLHGTRVVPGLSPEDRERNLAVLHMTYPMPVPAGVAALSRTLRRSAFLERSRRCQRQNRDFDRLTMGGLTWQVREALLNDSARRILADPDEFLDQRAVILKLGRTSTVGKSDGLVLKRWNFRKLENLLKDLFRPSRARRAYQAAYHLELLGIPTARSIATASKRCAGFLLRSYLLMEEIPGATELGEFFRQGNLPGRALLQRAGRLIGRLHDEGFSHRDLKESNLVLGAHGEVYLLDLDGLKFVDVLGEDRAALDLARLARGVSKFPQLTSLHQAIFLRAYCRTRRRRHVPRRGGETAE